MTQTLPKAANDTEKPVQPITLTDLITMRLLKAVDRMVVEDREHLIVLLRAMRQLTRHQTPMTVAFACLVLAELGMIEAEMPLDAAAWHQLRGYAADVAERLA